VRETDQAFLDVPIVHITLRTCWLAMDLVSIVHMTSCTHYTYIWNDILTRTRTDTCTHFILNDPFLTCDCGASLSESMCRTSLMSQPTLAHKTSAGHGLIACT